MSDPFAGPVPVYSEEWGRSFLEKMQEYMDALYDDSTSDIEEYRDVPTLSGYPFCGCEDCDHRERYLMAAKLILEGARDGEIRLA